MTHSIVQFKSSWYWIRPLGIICNPMHSFKSYYKQYADTHRVVSTCQHCIAFPLEESTAWIERYTNVKFSSRIRSGSSTWLMQCSTVDPIRLYVLPSPVLSTHSSSHALLRGSSNGPWFNSFRKDQESRVWFTNIPLRSAGILVSIVDWPIETCWSWDAILSRKKSNKPSKWNHDESWAVLSLEGENQKLHKCRSSVRCRCLCCSCCRLTSNLARAFTTS